MSHRIECQSTFLNCTVVFSSCSKDAPASGQKSILRPLPASNNDQLLILFSHIHSSHNSNLYGHPTTSFIHSFVVRQQIKFIFRAYQLDSNTIRHGASKYLNIIIICSHLILIYHLTSLSGIHSTISRISILSSHSQRKRTLALQVLKLFNCSRSHERSQVIIYFNKLPKAQLNSVAFIV